jgi:lipoprotein-releasing system permease protein
LLKGNYENLDSPTGPRRDGVIIGWEIARILGIFTGEDVTLVLPAGHVLPTGPAPKLKKFRVVGIFSSGFYEYDIGLAYISLTSAQKFFSIGRSISGLEVRLDNIYQSKFVMQLIEKRLDRAYHIQDWTEMNKSLFSAINLEKLAMFLILALIVLVAAFNIISTLVMMVMEKHSDIATLKSMGATPKSIMKIFMLEGSVIGVIGTAIGTVLGIAVCWIADTYKLINLEGGAYYLDHLPFMLTGLDIVLVVVSALIICFVSTIYPARQASKLDPVAVFRYE